MKITQALLDDLTARAKASPRPRMNYDLRNFSADQSQRMLNALEPGTPLPIHRHMKSSETVVCRRGHLREMFYNEAGEVTEVIDLAPGSDCVALNFPIGQWHTVEVLESGTVIMEVKDGAHEPIWAIPPRKANPHPCTARGKRLGSWWRGRRSRDCEASIILQIFQRIRGKICRIILY